MDKEVKTTHDSIVNTTDEIQERIFRDHDFLVSIGDLYWHHSYGYGRVLGIGLVREEAENVFGANNISVVFSFQNEGETTVKEYSIRELLEHTEYKPFPLTQGNAESFVRDSEMLANGEIDHESLLLKYGLNEVNGGTSSDLIIIDKSLLVEKKRLLTKQTQFLESRRQYAKDILESRMRKMRDMLNVFENQIQKLNRLIYTIELYLGIKEELHQLQTGTWADAQEPICFRQRRLYMDVEVGNPMDDGQGIDFISIEVFDEWLLRKNSYWNKYNYELMIPEPKGVVVFRVRREDKKYDKNPFINSMMNNENHMTYLLIRNGENVFRIYGDLKIGHKLFPDQDEFTKNEKNKFYDAKGVAERYKLNMVLLQGIIERSPCFPNEAPRVNLFKPDDAAKFVKFIYDDNTERQLPSDVLPFMNWMQRLNQKIEKGSRIFWIERMLESRRYLSERYFKQHYSNDYSVPNPPQTGVYSVYSERVETFGKARDVLFIKFHSTSERAWSWSDYGNWEDMKRKNRLSFEVYKEDQCLINFDEIDRKQLKTLEFYLHTRIGREEYLRYIPILHELFKAKQHEIRQEDDFIRLCLSEANLDPDQDFNKGVDALEWWKLKNKWKRSLSVDDVKALRMIVKKLKKT